MMDDIVGDYKDKTVTLEDFPFFANNIKMASVHPCKHASVMKTLLDRADAALRIRREKLKSGKTVGRDPGMEDLVDEVAKLDVKSAQEAADKDEWEEVEGVDADEQEVAIRVDQYLVVFLKVCMPRSRSCPMEKHLGGLKQQCTLTSRLVVHGKRHSRYRARLYNGGVSNFITGFQSVIWCTMEICHRHQLSPPPFHPFGFKSIAALDKFSCMMLCVWYTENCNWLVMVTG
jgi:hypothetical protein